jgi:hypothetical protein
LIRHSDPYQDGEPLRVYLTETDGRVQPSEALRRILAQNVYLPPAVVYVTPFAMLPWGIAHLLWKILSAIALALAAYLMCSLGCRAAPRYTAILVCFILANCEAIFTTGNSAGIAVSLCVVGVWCISQERFVRAGLLCLAVSLLLKPHDAGLVWLSFLLAGGINRKRAVQALMLTAVLALPCLLWISHLAPNWIAELHANHLIASLPGGTSDPGPASAVNGKGPSMIIDLQSDLAVFRNDPRFYDPASFLVCGTLLLLWAVAVHRSRRLASNIWFSLAAVVPLTLLVVYHRPYDAKLLLLTVPASAMLWAEGGIIARFAVLLNAAAIIVTADVPLVILLVLTGHLPIPSAGIFGKIATVVLTRPVPIILLLMCIAYLWVLWQRGSTENASTPKHGKNMLAGN